jgi:ArsR family transcriptional regulator
MKTSNIVKSLVALGHDSRLEIYNLLMSKGEEGITTGEIAKKLGITGATLSFHLANLTDAKLIESRKQGRNVYYSVKYKRVKKLIKYLSTYCYKNTDGELSDEGDEI